MICIRDEKTCCGCGACAVVCPAGCIAMVPGTLGSVFPQVDEEKCIQCGKCNTVCPMAHADIMKKVPTDQSVYAAYAKDPLVRNGGSSGGMFGTIAAVLLSKGYRVYGAAFDEVLKLRCVYADRLEELTPLLKSKYLQSDPSEAYPQIRKDLQQGRNVLFVSTPCQVAALRRYLQVEYENLLTVDFLCHGVPSQQLFDQCKHYGEERFNSKIISYQFRTKIPGGATPHYFTVEMQKHAKRKQITKPYFRSPFYAFFQKYISLRESCYDCTFAERGRVADLTIGDFHDIGKYDRSINRFDGVSTVIVNSPKGQMLFQEIKPQLWATPFSVEHLMRDRVLFADKTKRPKGRDQFIKDYESLPFSSFVSRNMDKKRYFLYSVYYRMPEVIRCALRKICHIS